MSDYRSEVEGAAAVRVGDAVGLRQVQMQLDKVNPWKSQLDGGTMCRKAGVSGVSWGLRREAS